jgi:Peptidase C65 Otubain
VSVHVLWYNASQLTLAPLLLLWLLLITVRYSYSTTTATAATAITTVQHCRFQGVSSIRGDGSCYYRAVIYAALKYHLQRSNRAALTSIAQQLRAQRYSNWWHTKQHSALLSFLAELFDERLTPAAAVARLDAALADDDSGVDSALMLVCRKLVADRLRSDAPLQLPDGHTLDALLDGKTVEQVLLYY